MYMVTITMCIVKIAMYIGIFTSKHSNFFYISSLSRRYYALQ